MNLDFRSEKLERQSNTASKSIIYLVDIVTILFLIRYLVLLIGSVGEERYLLYSVLGTLSNYAPDISSDIKASVYTLTVISLFWGNTAGILIKTYDLLKAGQISVCKYTLLINTFFLIMCSRELYLAFVALAGV